MKSQVDKFREKLMRAVKLENIDENQSLTFLKRNYGIQPSEIIMAVLIAISLITFILDGCGILASICCFVLPCINCYNEISQAEGESHIQGIRGTQQHQNSQYTDEQFSQIVSNSKGKAQIVEIYIVYFAVYAITEVISPFMNYVIGSISWLIIRAMLTFVMVFNKKKKRLSYKMLEYIKSKHELSRRRAQF